MNVEVRDCVTQMGAERKREEEERERTSEGWERALHQNEGELD